MDATEIFLAVIAILVGGLLIWSALSFFQGTVQNTPQNYSSFVSAEDPNNICATPAGYTEQQWKEHMSHHPERYAACLNK